MRTRPQSAQRSIWPPSAAVCHHFYSSEAGQKLVKKMPILIQQITTHLPKYLKGVGPKIRETAIEVAAEKKYHVESKRQLAQISGLYRRCKRGHMGGPRVIKVPLMGWTGCPPAGLAFDG
jgi:hypothetical protein